MYKTSNLWMQHLEKEHILETWQCNICDDSHQMQTFDSSSKFERHCDREHSRALTAGEVKLVVKFGSLKQPKDLYCCVFCGWHPTEVSTATVQGRHKVLEHMAKDHMQDFALLSLPWIGDGATEASPSASAEETLDDEDYKNKLLQEPWLGFQDEGAFVRTDAPSYSHITDSFLPVGDSSNHVELWLLTQEPDHTSGHYLAPRPRFDNPKHYSVALIAALPHECAAVIAVLDEEHERPAGFKKYRRDTNAYTWGRIGDHNVVITSLPSGVYGTTAAGSTANQLLSSLPHIRFGLMVGIGAGVPQPNVADVRLGDVVVSKPRGSSGGVIQHDLVKIKEGTSSTGHLAKPPIVLLHALEKLQSDHLINDSIVPSVLKAMLEKHPQMKKKSPKNPGFTHPGADNDRLFAPWRQHVGGADCSDCPEADTISRDRRDTTDPEIHYGVIASRNALVKNANERDEILKRLPDDVRNECLCIEVEAAGLMDTFPCIVIRGICDYADSHKNDIWQKYAAATAAAFAKVFLGFVDVQEVEKALELHKAVEKGL